MIVRLNDGQTAAGPEVTPLADGSIECPYGVGSAIVLAGHGVRVDVPAAAGAEGANEAGPGRKARKAGKGN